MIPRDRLDDAPIEGRAPLRWPDGVVAWDGTQILDRYLSHGGGTRVS